MEFLFHFGLEEKEINILQSIKCYLSENYFLPSFFDPLCLPPSYYPSFPFSSIPADLLPSVLPFLTPSCHHLYLLSLSLLPTWTYFLHPAWCELWCPAEGLFFFNLEKNSMFFLRETVVNFFQEGKISLISLNSRGVYLSHASFQETPEGKE